VHKGRVLISDCILALTPTRGDEDRLFRALTSKKGREAVEAISHGVGAKFITPGALLKIRI
jgi:type I restriction enzyme M protein